MPFNTTALITILVGVLTLYGAQLLIDNADVRGAAHGYRPDERIETRRDKELPHVAHRGRNVRRKNYLTE